MYAVCRCAYSYDDLSRRYTAIDYEKYEIGTIGACLGSIVQNASPASEELACMMTYVEYSTPRARRAIKAEALGHQIAISGIQSQRRTYSSSRMLGHAQLSTARSCSIDKKQLRT